MYKFIHHLHTISMNDWLEKFFSLSVSTHSDTDIENLSSFLLCMLLRHIGHCKRYVSGCMRVMFECLINVWYMALQSYNTSISRLFKEVSKNRERRLYTSLILVLLKWWWSFLWWWNKSFTPFTRFVSIPEWVFLSIHFRYHLHITADQ